MLEPGTEGTGPCLLLIIQGQLMCSAIVSGQLQTIDIKSSVTLHCFWWCNHGRSTFWPHRYVCWSLKLKEQVLVFAIDHTRVSNLFCYCIRSVTDSCQWICSHYFSRGVFMGEQPSGLTGMNAGAWNWRHKSLCLLLFMPGWLTCSAFVAGQLQMTLVASCFSWCNHGRMTFWSHRCLCWSLELGEEVLMLGIDPTRVANLLC